MNSSLTNEPDRKHDERTEQDAAGRDEHLHTSPDGAAERRVLIVEDNPNAAFLMQQVLGDFCSVTLTTTADAALDLAQQVQFQVVLMDINLGPGGSGLHVLERLRAMPGYHDVPVIAITAYALPGDRKRFLELGFSEYLSKPFTAPMLQEAVERHLTP